MTEYLVVAASFLVGIMIGQGFFWGLWATVKQLPRTRHVLLLVLGSLVLRLGAALLVFFLFAYYGNWVHVIAVATGFILSRIFVIRRLRLTETARES